MTSVNETNGPKGPNQYGALDAKKISIDEKFKAMFEYYDQKGEYLDSISINNKKNKAPVSESEGIEVVKKAFTMATDPIKNMKFKLMSEIFGGNLSSEQKEQLWAQVASLDSKVKEGALRTYSSIRSIPLTITNPKDMGAAFAGYMQGLYYGQLVNDERGYENLLKTAKAESFSINTKGGENKNDGFKTEEINTGIKEKEVNSIFKKKPSKKPTFIFNNKFNIS